MSFEKTMEMTKGRIDVPNEELTLAEEKPSPRLAEAMREALRISADPAAKGYADTKDLFEALNA